jgi:beta-glucanase (GH16 family)
MKKLSILFVLVSILGCTKEETTPEVLQPSNLVVTIEKSSTIEGLVDLTATASSANYYSFEFFSGSTSETIESPTGEVSYQFNATGTYKIVTRAHATFSAFIQIEDSISVTVTQGGTGIPTSGYSTPLTYSGYNLVWNDEFDGNQLSNSWTHEIGIGNNGWGNNELQYYRPQNTEVKDGYLMITAKKEPFADKQYTSSRIITKGKQSFKYGRVDIRAALPKGKGLWPAAWMLGDAFTTVGWPACGEIDIMEMVGGNSPNQGDATVHGTVHWQTNNGNHGEYGGSNSLNNGIYADEFHVFSIIWESGRIKWYRDDIKFNEIDISSSQFSEFREDFFFIFNVAVGGNWPGSPNSSTQFPQRMIVDYIRVFQK